MLFLLINTHCYDILNLGGNPLPKKTLSLDDVSVDELSLLYGVNDCFLKSLEASHDVVISARDNQLNITANKQEDIDQVEIIIDNCLLHIKKHQAFDQNIWEYIVSLSQQQFQTYQQYLKTPLTQNFHSKLIYPKTIGQALFIESMKTHECVFAIGPAGTGKTYLAVVYAVACLKQNKIKKIILTRPAVEAGENLGFLPGDLKEKVDPYLRPLYDSLYDMLGVEQTNRYMEKGVIEIAPLAYMRGRTLENAFVILDEAQNTLPSQMKMFLTRMGLGSQIVITGDITQIDLPSHQKSGLIDALHLLKGISDIGFIELSQADVVRHPLVRKILQRYEAAKKSD